MNYASIEQISKAYGERIIFQNISFGINAGQKIGLIAKNGTGKTSLLKILSGQDHPDEGEINYRNNIKISFLSQEPDLDENLTVEETIFASENEILKVIAQYEKALQHPEDTENFQKAFDLMEAKQAWDFETTYKQVLSKLKLEKLDQRVKLLSGGQKKRLALATLLLDHPDLLILDEPTNHLDLEMIEWLEEFFKKEDITLLMVTHDRYFLERVCNEILELENGVLYSYKGNYSYYLDKKEARVEIEKTNTDKAQQLYKKELDWMRRQPKARTSKSKSRIDDFTEIKAKASQRRKEHEVQLEINMERLGNKIVELHNVSKSFEDKILLDKFNYNFQPGERVGIIGKNGTGKSTFLNILTSTLKPDHGKLVMGETVKFGYYTQKGIPIKEGQKVIEVIREFGDYIPLKKGRQISAQQLLERFLFDRKKQYDYVEKLSGGERKRLYLCTVLIQNPNFLILDEPTNDLDIVTLNVLENFLLDFPGCLIVVSHDRYFMDKIVDHLFVFRGAGVIEDFPGNYSDFRAYDKSKPTEITPPTETKDTSSKNNWKNSNEDQKLTYNEQKEYKRLEKEISKLEKEKEKVQQEFLSELSEEEINKKSQNLQKILDEIENKTERWFELSAKME
ncbi:MULTISPECIES: ABC-F family ATP-binding cassette domain-containing protein [Mesonia]|uniref:Energy-dependent translational throttle protein EttA n=1 Tax=Mesonia oceanica TaxID=2687242 RepID=A0AC61Y9V3_9FLAO|nr:MULTISPECIES: ABC-F family ATP-binding cassette domain-containing protein [Mesonia]MAN26634.1 ABC transporter [Mesonia sp.]MAQ40089.1 ABC transporter [Mesonia sp.]MBJ96609.1 ABC transporter [Flavobacteriaceae bacterium]VVV01302.1 Energy-dependent translational throttle protein EttA [Mesonia oceanica]